MIPTAFVSFDFSALGKTFGQVFKTDFSGVGILNFFAVMFSFLFVDLFDTLGTLIGVASKADMLDEDGKLPRIKGALMADSIATCAGAVLGTSTTTTFVESASGEMCIRDSASPLWECCFSFDRLLVDVIQCISFCARISIS